MALTPLESALELVLESCQELKPRAVPLADCLGCVTSAPIRASEPVPPFANTAMDGYAVRSADTAGAPVRLEVVGSLAAGAAPEIELGPGQAVRIMTGAPMPPGADSVVMIERTTAVEGGAVVVVEEAAVAGDHVRLAGEDISPGEEVFAERTVLGPGHLGVLASLGLVEVEVFPRPVVGVLSTGDELVEGSGDLRPGRIRDANRPALVALAGEQGFVPVDLGIVPDEEDRITSVLEHGLERCDAVVTSGGVSVGDFDYVKVVLDRLTGGSMRWMQLAIRPAKPFAFGTVGSKPVFGLPGNPVSSMVSFELLARPGLRKLAGHNRLERPAISAVADEDLSRRPDGKTHFVRVVAEMAADGRYHVRASGGQASHMLKAMAGADGLVVLPDGEGAPAGSEVSLLLLGRG